MRLRAGKLPPELLEGVVYKYLGAPSDRVLVGPKVGEDAAVIDMGEKVLVVHTDPITGAVENVGWLAVCVSTNDVATRGAKPLWLSVAVLLPEGADEELLEKVESQMDEAARELGVAIVGGHTEVTPGLRRPVVVATAIGEAEKGKYVTSSGARPGDAIILTKGAAVEGTSILAHELEELLVKEVGREVVERAKGYVRLVSVAKEALAAVGTGAVTAMHDPTEGGVLGGVQELCLASGVGAKVYEGRVPVRDETKALCGALGVNPLKLISSGSLLIAAKPEGAEGVMRAVREVGVEAAMVGEFTEEAGVLGLVRRDGVVEKITEPVYDELWAALEAVLE